MSTNGVAVLDVDPLQPLPTQEELACCVESKTYRQIQDLKIDCHGSSVKVTGRSRTYYLKQLATQAILTTAPAAKLENAIRVCAG